MNTDKIKLESRVFSLMIEWIECFASLKEKETIGIVVLIHFLPETNDSVKSNPSRPIDFISVGTMITIKSESALYE
jgi:hypothetical protein